jgi:hypothetical protein
MKKWIKLTKSYRNGEKIDYKYVDATDIDTPEKQEEICEQWGENTDGGHSYGYSVNLDVLKKDEFPPKEWLVKEISDSKRKIKYILEERIITKRERIQAQKEKIQLYQHLLQK